MSLNFYSIGVSSGQGFSSSQLDKPLKRTPADVKPQTNISQIHFGKRTAYQEKSVLQKIGQGIRVGIGGIGVAWISALGLQDFTGHDLHVGHSHSAEEHPHSEAAEKSTPANQVFNIFGMLGTAMLLMHVGIHVFAALFVLNNLLQGHKHTKISIEDFNQEMAGFNKEMGEAGNIRMLPVKGRKIESGRAVDIKSGTIEDILAAINKEVLEPFFDLHASIETNTERAKKRKHSYLVLRKVPEPQQDRPFSRGDLRRGLQTLQTCLKEMGYEVQIDDTGIRKKLKALKPEKTIQTVEGMASNLFSRLGKFGIKVPEKEELKPLTVARPTLVGIG